MGRKKKGNVPDEGKCLCEDVWGLGAAKNRGKRGYFVSGRVLSK